MLAPSGVPVAIQCQFAQLEHTGRPLDPQLQWDVIGTTLADASTQWCPSGDPVLICIIGTHWKTTGKPLEDHWKHTGISPVAFQCTLGSKFQAHWIATGLPLEDHWLRVRASPWAEFTYCALRTAVGASVEIKLGASLITLECGWSPQGAPPRNAGKS